MDYPMRLGEVSLSDKAVATIRTRATIMPFVAVLTGVLVGYLLIRPTLKDVQTIMNAIKAVFPILAK